MKIKLLGLTVLLTAIALVTACSGPDDKQMKPYTGGGLDSSMTGNDLLSGFGTGSDANSLPSRPGSPWQPISGKENVLPLVYFAFDQYDIAASQIPAMNAIAKYMQNNPNEGIIIEGHCDERGSAEYNMGLGEKRALSAREYLTKLGIPENRIQTISYGSERPIALGHSEDAWAQNRRAHFIPSNMN